MVAASSTATFPKRPRESTRRWVNSTRSGVGPRPAGTTAIDCTGAVRSVAVDSSRSTIVRDSDRSAAGRAATSRSNASTSRRRSALSRAARTVALRGRRLRSASSPDHLAGSDLGDHRGLVLRQHLESPADEHVERVAALASGEEHAAGRGLHRGHGRSHRPPGRRGQPTEELRPGQDLEQLRHAAGPSATAAARWRGQQRGRAHAGRYRPAVGSPARASGGSGTRSRPVLYSGDGGGG